jgi:hypothetical protein
MKAQPFGPRPYPHVISRIGGRRNSRWPVLFSNVPIEDPQDGTWVIAGSGNVGRHEKPSAQGRRTLIRQVSERARVSKARYCIVLSEAECSFLLPDGSMREGSNPPHGDPVPEESTSDTTPIRCEPVWSIPIRGRAASHLCLKQTGEFVEVMLGARIVLGDFSDYPPGCEDDPAAHLRDETGQWKKALSYCGQPVHSVTNEGVLLGPVQPLELTPTITLRSPWPDELERACSQIAGRPLPDIVLRSAWAAIDPDDEIKDVMNAAWRSNIRADNDCPLIAWRLTMEKAENSPTG